MKQYFIMIVCCFSITQAMESDEDSFGQQSSSSGEIVRSFSAPSTLNLREDLQDFVNESYDESVIVRSHSEFSFIGGEGDFLAVPKDSAAYIMGRVLNNQITRKNAAKDLKIAEPTLAALKQRLHKRRPSETVSSLLAKEDEASGCLDMHELPSTDEQVSLSARLAASLQDRLGAVKAKQPRMHSSPIPAKKSSPTELRKLSNSPETQRRKVEQRKIELSEKFKKYHEKKKQKSAESLLAEN